ncbi:hypothetical protein GCM10023340_30470 [Nocardioides marinquilinus]|uniref:DUF3618 domain-containing protein n=1 Tax=Nocardioides marinquilinus TaxID=1210400 RepID=A0ABP9PT80_9ACTN
MSSYDDLASLAEMDADARATREQLRLRQAVDRVVRPAPSLHFDEQPGERAKRGLEVSAAAAALAAAIYVD